MKNKKSFFRLFLLTVLSTLFLAPSDSEAQKAQALSSLNAFLVDDIDAASLKQVKGLSQSQFNDWLKKSPIKSTTKTFIRKELKPLLAASVFEAVIIKGVKLKSNGSKADLVLVGVPANLAAQVKGTDVYIIVASSDSDNVSGGEQPKCRYMKCYRTEDEGSGICVSATRFSDKCPADQCSSDNDCGGGGSNIMDALGVF